jgi:hypothetical protein
MQLFITGMSPKDGIMADLAASMPYLSNSGLSKVQN